MTTTLLQKTALASLALLSQLALAAEIPMATPEEVGMSSDRLNRITTAMQRHIDAGDIQGRSR